LSKVQERHQVRFVGIAQKPKWVSQDVCNVLGIGSARNALRNLELDEKGMYSIHTPDGERKVLTVTQPGLYRLLFTQSLHLIRQKSKPSSIEAVFGNQIAAHEMTPEVDEVGQEQVQQQQWQWG